MVGDIAFNPQVLAPFFTPGWQKFSLAGGVHKLVSGDSNRVLLAVGITVGGTAWLTHIGDAIGNVGLPVQQSGGPLLIRYADFGALVGGEWYLRCSALLTEGFFLTQSYTPQR